MPSPWDWILIAIGYGLALFLFRILGGFHAAGDAMRRWGRSRSTRAPAARS
jgi:hypothetical protein